MLARTRRRQERDKAADLARAQWLSGQLGWTPAELQRHGLPSRGRDEQRPGRRSRPAPAPAAAPRRQSAGRAAGAPRTHSGPGLSAAAGAGRQKRGAPTDQLRVVGVRGCPLADEVAAAARKLRGQYVDDLRVWIQLHPSPESFADWSERNGFSSAPVVTVNGEPIPETGGDVLQEFRAFSEAWRGQKLSRDAGCSSLVLRHFCHDGLSATSAILGDRLSGRAFVIDPVYTLPQYMQALAEEELELCGVLLTHTRWAFPGSHAQLHVENDRCQVLVGPQPERGCRSRAYEYREVADGEEIALGPAVRVRCLHTPGPTLDSVSYVVVVSPGAKGDDAVSAADVECAVFTGATLLTDTVGRFDVEAKVVPQSLAKMTQEGSLRALYGSVQRLVRLPPQCAVFPSYFGIHFAGAGVEPKLSTCIRVMADQAVLPLTLMPGLTKSSPAASEEAWMQWASRLPALSMPESFRELFMQNLIGPLLRPSRSVPRTPPAVMAAEHVARTGGDVSGAGVAEHVLPRTTAASGKPACLVIDVRNQDDFAECHISGSLALPMLSAVRFEGFAAAMIGRHEGLRIAVASESAKAAEALARLSAAGINDIESLILMDGIADEADAVSHSTSAYGRLRRLRTSADLESLGSSVVLDVRSGSEYAAQAVPGAIHVPLEDLKQWSMSDGGRQLLRRCTQDGDMPVLYCAGGYRSLIGASILAAVGVPLPADITGGGLDVMSMRPDLWTLKDPQAKCTS
eukprot:TRINITY_DN26404_c0_g1_i2.p1 TRINITY_DN26404_c0_g1~~TRINITY_DN26404_c0_g1_i2.p1  ORF type:complete len:742 (+),score=159.45 TRINITY_DN26404_c0_g1_i2:58-2283(+)